MSILKRLIIKRKAINEQAQVMRDGHVVRNLKKRAKKTGSLKDYRRYAKNKARYGQKWGRYKA